MAVVDHLIKAAAEEIIGHRLALQNSLENSQVLNQNFGVPGGFALWNLPCKPSIYAGSRGFAVPTQ